MSSINLSSFIATIINFLIFLFLLKKFLFKPVNNVIENRKIQVENTIKKAEEDKKEAENLRLESEKQIKEAKEHSKGIIENYKINAEKASDEIISEANKEAERILDRAKKEIEREKEKAKDEIKLQVIDLAIELSEKVLQESIDEEKHRKMIEDFIVKVGS